MAARKKRTRTAAAKPAPTARQAASKVEDLVHKPKRPRPFTGRIPKLKASYERIVEKVFDLKDPVGEYALLEREMKLEESLSPQVIKRALNLSEDYGRRANKLLQNAVLANKLLELEMEPIEAALRAEALRELQKLKDAGEFSKQIAEKDVTSEISASWPDEWRVICDRRARAEGMLKYLRRVSELWHDRNKTLGSMNR